MTLPPAPGLVSALLVLLVLAVAGAGALGLAGLTPVRPRPPSLPAAGLLAEEVAAGSAAALSLPPATRPPVPLAAALRHQPPLAPRETFGFLPYWTLPSLPTADLQGLTTVAYFSVGVDGAGQAVESGPGWTAYRSAALAQVVSEVHRAGGRVVLTLSCFSQTALDQLTTDPAAQATLAATTVHLVAAAGLDGVNLDLEGTGSADRAGLVQLVATVASAVHHVDPAWQVTVDTYGSSATDPGGFFDVPALARVADALVVMAYDMQDPRYPGPTAPLDGPGETDQAVLAQYLAAIPASQVIVGLPLFAVAWPTTGPEAGAAASGPPTYLTDLAVPRQQVYWDPTTQTPWAVIGAGNAVDQIWFDDQASLAAKARAALTAGVRGVALWALGMPPAGSPPRDTRAAPRPHRSSGPGPTGRTPDPRKPRAVLVDRHGRLLGLVVDGVVRGVVDGVELCATGLERARARLDRRSEHRRAERLLDPLRRLQRLGHQRGEQRGRPILAERRRPGRVGGRAPQRRCEPVRASRRARWKVARRLSSGKGAARPRLSSPGSPAREAGRSAKRASASARLVPTRTRPHPRLPSSTLRSPGPRRLRTSR
ncbi:glycosyl hydrolase family 18 protein [Aciditerrimonas ferrireducens]|nr:glycosyl hydrolase family 18 protein [Aciditerrimonas ferrireducens]